MTNYEEDPDIRLGETHYEEDTDIGWGRAILICLPVSNVYFFVGG